MKIPYSYLEDEVKDGFYVDSMMKCCWAAQMEILTTIDEICQKHNIQYFAEWGTMLGAIRHNGFIPWDDDMDITMKRADYNKFLKVAKQELPEGYHVMNYVNDGDYWDVMSRVVNSKYICMNADFLEKFHYFPFSAGIDIFPMDYVPVNKGEAEVLKNLVANVKGAADAYGGGALSEEEFEEALRQLEVLCNRKIDRAGDVREHLYDIVVSLYALYHEDESEEICLMPLWLESGSQSYPKQYYSQSVRIPFGLTTIPVPVAYDAILKKKYGDYMKMVRKGGSHDYPYYKKQIDTLAEHDIIWPSFQYTDRIIRKENEANEQEDFGADNIRVLEEAHAGLLKLLLVHEDDMAMQLLTRCQECAISFGNRIENSVSGCEGLIHSLEEYCEIVFQIHQLLAQGDSPEPGAVFGILQEQLETVKKEYDEEYEKKKKIVFIIDKAAKWKSLESVWKAAKKDNNNTVSVLAIPYYYRGFDGTILEEHYEREQLPEYVEACDYQNFNLEQYHPDVIFINSPYDEYNYFSSIHPNFYSSKLVQYTEKLIYIPWFTITELTREDERGWQSMQHFVTMPGVVNADKVFVQSEQMRETYVAYLTEWAGEETRSAWEEKIQDIHTLHIEQEHIEKKEIPADWESFVNKSDGSRKKMVLYSISGTGFAEHGMQAVDKLRTVLEIFKENRKNIALIWYPDQAIEAALKCSHPDLWDAYVQILKQYREEGWGIYGDNMGSKEAAALCDAYYGDPCVLSQAVVIEKKPVMLQNFEC